MSALLLLPALLAAAPADPERAGLLHVIREYERVGLTAPTSDPILTAAARKLATQALDTSVGEATDPLAISGVVSDAGGWDPSPRAIIIRSSPPEYALETFLKRRDLNTEPATHVGMGVVVRGDRGALAVILSERKVELRPFPHALPGPGSRSLCGELRGPLRRAELYATRPHGTVDRVGLTREQGAAFCAMPSFPTEGRHSVEVIGHGPRGPEVAAIFYVDVGATRPDSARFRAEEPTTAEAARPAVLARINALRRALKLSPVEPDEALDKVAQAYSERMVREGFFAHVAPDGSSVSTRLKRAGYRFERVGENLGLAGGPLAAHFVLEHSPGHRRNIIEPDFTHVGIGVAFERKGDRTQAIVTQIFARSFSTRSSRTASLQDAYDVLAQKRRALKLPPLKRSEVLEQIATTHARTALSLDTPEPKLPGARLHDRVFEAFPDVKAAAADFVV
ncbi:MAG TPA: CAP domain-containing protein, partial [Myxococcaceae bacterium]|nr:CAP domain-containing protein [Myxococcaceae bacterium]